MAPVRPRLVAGFPALAAADRPAHRYPRRRRNPSQKCLLGSGPRYLPVGRRPRDAVMCRLVMMLWSGRMGVATQAATADQVAM